MMIATLSSGADTRLLHLLEALADENRLRIMDVLRRGEQCVCELQSALDIGQSLLSHHLKSLRQAGLVRDRREGRWVFYALVPETLERMETYLAALRFDAAAAPRSGGRGCAP